MEDQSETYPPQITVAIYEKWNQQAHGIKYSEKHYVDYFNTKNLVILSYTKEELIYEQLIGCINDMQNLKEEFQNERIFEINTIIMYRYKDRDFCIKHNGVEKFQKLWRKFHYKIMPRYKNIHNLQHRSIYGKFKK
tara:strand:- start:1482 stop:1889 length:408 start_codon:yes stop_codon:yes gene_type:complete